MAAKSKLTPDLRKTIVALAAEHSLRDVERILAERGTPFGKTTVATVMQEAEERAAREQERAQGGDGAQGRAGRGAGGSRGVGEGTGRGEAQGDSAYGAEVPMPPLPEDATVAARALYESLRVTRQRLAELPRDEDFATDYAALARVELQQLKQLGSMLPKEKPDPAKDPCNVAARSLVLHQASSTIAAVKERARKLGFRFPDDDQ